jgi:hypothetical protein
MIHALVGMASGSGSMSNNLMFWRLVALFGVMTLELGWITSSFSTPSIFFPNITINERSEILRQFFLTFIMAASQLAPVWFPESEVKSVKNMISGLSDRVHVLSQEIFSEVSLTSDLFMEKEEQRKTLLNKMEKLAIDLQLSAQNPEYSKALAQARSKLMKQ